MLWVTGSGRANRNRERIPPGVSDGTWMQMLPCTQGQALFFTVLCDIMQTAAGFTVLPVYNSRKSAGGRQWCAEQYVLV